MAGGINHPHAIYKSTFNWGYPMNLILFSDWGISSGRVKVGFSGLQSTYNDYCVYIIDI